MPYKRRSRFWWTFSIPRLGRFFQKRGFFNSHSRLHSLRGFECYGLLPTVIVKPEVNSFSGVPTPGCLDLEVRGEASSDAWQSAPPCPRTSFQAKGVNVAIPRADINHPIHDYRRGIHDVADRVAPQLSAGVGIQGIDIVVDRADVNHPIRHGG